MLNKLEEVPVNTGALSALSDVDYMSLSVQSFGFPRFFCGDRGVPEGSKGGVVAVEVRPTLWCREDASFCHIPPCSPVCATLLLCRTHTYGLFGSRGPHPCKVRICFLGVLSSL